jgi:hypothetical protein
MLALIQRCVARGELSPAARHWQRVREVDRRVQLPPESAIPLASALVLLRERSAALETLRGALEDPAARLSGALALQAVELARSLADDALVQQAAKSGLALPYLSPEIRERLQSFIGPPVPASAASPVPESAPATAELPVEVPPSSVESDAPAQASAPSRRIAVLEGTPDRLCERGISMRLADRTLELGYERIQALAVAGLPGEVPSEPLMLIDLVLNWSAPASEPLHVIRVRSDRFDTRVLVGDALGPREAIRVFLHELRANLCAVALPDEASAEARPLRLYASLADYEREVLGVSR